MTSSATVTLDAPPAAEAVDLRLWGGPGWSSAPLADRDDVAVLRIALTELAAAARSTHPSHPCDVSFGRAIVAVLADAEAQLPS